MARSLRAVAHGRKSADNKGMTAVEKQNVYLMLRAAACCALGYAAPDFAAAAPAFADDAERPLPPAAAAAPAEAAPPPAAGSRLPGETPPGGTGATLESVAAKIAACRNCALAEKRHNVVPGEGVAHPAVMVIGEGPGEDEDKTGRPFVGRAGQLLDKMLAAIQLDRACNCFIANIVKCRPPANRTPLPQEAAACSGYLQAQIHILKPRMILAMGRTAVQNLLQTSQGINALRGRLLDYGGIPLMATYHPSALLRNEELKRPAWEDLKAARAKLLELCPDYAEAFARRHAG